MRYLEHRGCLKLSLSRSHKQDSLDKTHTHTHTHTNTTQQLSEKKTLKPAAPTILYLIYCSEELEEKLREPPPKKGKKKKELQTPKRMDFPLRSLTSKNPEICTQEPKP
jgi:hypothetical protein